jgi:hypothetical protein
MGYSHTAHTPFYPIAIFASSTLFLYVFHKPPINKKPHDDRELDNPVHVGHQKQLNAGYLIRVFNTCFFQIYYLTFNTSITIIRNNNDNIKYKIE